jgi:AraC family transcriptional regulator
MSEPLAIIDQDADPLDRAMRYIETHAREALSLEDLANVAGLSAYHFARQFTARFGVSPIAHVKALRMAQAADLLAAKDPPALVYLAFDCGFESQEGFTRAFKRAFGVSPGRYRRAAPLITPKELAMSDVVQALNLTMQSKPQRKPGFRVAGVSGVFDETTKSGIPALWPRLIEKVPAFARDGGESFGVMWGEEGGAFHYMAGVPVDADTPTPAGLEVRDIAPQAYLVFRQVLDGSDLHPQMQAAGREIWGERLPKSGYKLARSPDLEFYPADFMPGEAGVWVEWWIPVQA